jgi:hypothetical protein
MSTRSTTHFIHGNEAQPTAIIYRHGDGYPEGAGRDLLAFLDKVGKLKDTRFGDPSYLAAKYVVYLADMFNVDYCVKDGNVYKRKASKLDFLSVGVVSTDPTDIEYRYIVDCASSSDRPIVRCYEVECSYPENVWTKTEIDMEGKAVEPRE